LVDSAQSSVNAAPFALNGDRFALPQAPSSARRVLLLVNRTAGAGRRRSLADEAAAALRAAGFIVDLPEDLEDLTQRATAALAAGDLRCVVGVGGDGTFAAALNATPPGVPLTVLPTGTENLMARYLRWTKRPADLVRLVGEGRPVALDAGVANGRLFALMASAGFDAEVVRRVHARRRGNISHLAYARPIVEALGQYPYPKVRVRLLQDDEQWADAVETIEGSWFFCHNLPCYASGLRPAPGASGLDGKLDLCVLRRGQIAAGLWYLWHIWRRRHSQLASVAMQRATSCRVESADGSPVPYQLDGDPGGCLPLDLSVAPSRLTVLVSQTTAQRLLHEHDHSEAVGTN
jgi:diacylglycerol kinase (ATP)